MGDDTIGTVKPDQATRRTDADPAWLPVVALGMGTFTVGTDMFVLAGILGGIAEDFHVGVGTAGLTVTVFAASYAIGAVSLGALLGPRPPRQVLIGSASLFGVVSVLSALAPTFPLLLVARIPAALAASAYVPAAGAAAVAAVPPSHRGRALGMILAGTSAAMVVSAPLGGLLASALSWRAAFGLIALLAGATVAALLLTDARWSAPPVRDALRERLRPARSPAVLGVLGVTLLVMTASFSMYTYLPLLVATGAGYPWIGLFGAAFGVGGMAGTWWGGTAADRRGPHRVGVLAVVGLAAGFTALPHLATTAGGALAVMVAWGVAAWGFVPAQQHRLIGLGAAARIPGRPGTGVAAPLLLALNSCAIQLGVAAGALFGGMVVEGIGADRLWTVAVVCCAAALGGLGILGKAVRA